MHILVTNDDGIHAPGLLALAKAMQPFGEVSILAPDHNWSICGHSKTLSRPLRVNEITLDGNIKALATDGAPSDCVALAVMGLICQPIDLVVSGINPHPNLGEDITYSGTVAAAMEAVIANIPAIAFSLDGFSAKHGELDFSTAATVATQVVKKHIDNELPTDIILNVNVPYLPLKDIKGFAITRTGKRIYHDLLLNREDPSGAPYYWIGGDPPSGFPDHNTDISALAEGYVSITPIHLDLTAHHWIGSLQNWKWNQVTDF